MRRVKLGRTGVEVPVISVGTWSYGGKNTSGPVSVGWSGHDPAQAEAALREAHALGLTHWDTADVYGNGRSEELIGRVLADLPREELFLASKVGWDKGGHDQAYHPDVIRAHLERSLTNLGVEQLDLFYLHHCDFGPSDASLDDAVALLRELRDEGKFRFVGLSDWDCAKIVRVADRVDPDVIQPYRNVAADTYVSSGLKAWIDEHDAGVAFFSPIRHGLLLGKHEGPQAYPEGDFRQNVAGFADAELLADLRAKAAQLRERLGGGEEAVLRGLLQPLLSDSPTGCVLLGLRTPDQVRQAAAADAALESDQVAFVRELYADLEV